VPRETPLPEVPFARLAKIVAEVIRAEGPVHADASPSGCACSGAGERLEAADRAALQQALRLAAQLEGVTEAGGFWSARTRRPPAPRDRRAAAPHLRRRQWSHPPRSRPPRRRCRPPCPSRRRRSWRPGVVRLLGLDAAAAPAVAARLAALVGAGVVRVPAG
jgi:hypothetical protein